MRLAKYLAQAGIASRRQAEEIIRMGRVKVNGNIVTELITLVDSKTDSIEYDGKIVGVEQHVYILLNKPPGYISAVNDPWGRATVLELVGEIKERIYPVGRLDYDTEGLLLLTNDGKFTNLMIHPRYNIDKKYEAYVAGRIKDNELMILRDGVDLEDGMTAPAGIHLISQNDRASIIRLLIHEGRKRQVKRMCAAVGHPVISLKRVAFAFLTLEGVEIGKYRYLQQDEVNRLQEIALHEL
ncbi:MAG: pseudouridine synthase [Firmicutes bacterium HGW-Firmicutes-15]|nr:MAG: pseudouridine synthase [Firmicutes bacterium HGW-Firmicutes-15]